ncbi:MAG: carbamoyl phosphate synthase large subunit [Planctomycetes bacterium SM23_32]|nr:MAG: carbamoyl phosphate synthase large subunit [Planctomycetes bacterium SM23_32]
MPKRTDIEKILIIGSGPIVISQACEFDYSGTQACKAIREEGYQIVLLNSNPATIMTDPAMADRTYVEPITVEALARIVERERPQALLATLGGQTALNVAVQAWQAGVLQEHGVEMIGANYEAILRAEDRELFRAALEEIGVDLPRSRAVHSRREADVAARQIDFPLVIRPSFTLGGTGGSIAYNYEEFEKAVAFGLESSIVNEVLIEEGVIGWKEYELEVMRDRKDNVVIICSIENLDPMGVHTGDSVTVAPAQTLTDKQYQRMRDAAIAIIRKVGVETGGSNIQFAVHPRTGRMVAIEMNPRVSRSSALASKATGFPIAKFAAKLALGYTLDEIPNDITRETPASFEPTIDYCVVKLPRFAFEKFPGADDTLTVSMKSVGETMAIGRTFKEALQKGLRGLEIGLSGFDQVGEARVDADRLRPMLARPNPDRLFYVKHALKSGVPVGEIAALTRIDPWFLHNMRDLVELEAAIAAAGRDGGLGAELLRRAKRNGFSDRQIAALTGSKEGDVRRRRLTEGIEAVFKLVDTCAAEFEAYTPYYYSTYEREDESRAGEKPKVLIIGGGPNRIGQGIEFDYCCVHAALALREMGYDTIMVNSNPETVSTDYDIANRLYFEPLTLEDLLGIIAREQPDGVIVQLGGQTPLNLAVPLADAGVRILGTSHDAIDRAEDRKLFRELLQKLEIRQPPSDTATSFEEAHRIAAGLGYPVLIRPSYVLGGRAMVIAWSEDQLEGFVREAIAAAPDYPILIDKFLDDAIEVDVDAVCDGEAVVVAGVMEHIEQAGVHSGDSAMVLPPHSLQPRIVQEIRDQTRRLARELNVVGLMNVQYAVKDEAVYVLEINPRASRTVPFVSKATGVPFAKVAAQVMVGKTLAELAVTADPQPPYFAVKESVMPFDRFPGVDPILGPEMKSTGEVMGLAPSFALAFAKSQMEAGQPLPLSGTVFVSVKDSDKHRILPVARKLAQLGFDIMSTEGTAAALRAAGVQAAAVPKLADARRPNILDRIKSGDVGLLINTPSGPIPRQDEITIRGAAVTYRIPLITTVAAAHAAAGAIEALQKGQFDVRSLQEIHGDAGTRPAARG